MLVASTGHATPPIAQTEPEAVATDRISLAMEQGDVVPLDGILLDAPSILHFWATWCAPCRAELPDLDAFAQDLEAEGLGDRLIVISVDRGGYEKIAAFLRDDLDLETLTSYQDVSGKVGTTFRLFGFPSTVLLDAGHRIVGRISGPLDWRDPSVRKALDEHLGAGF